MRSVRLSLLGAGTVGGGVIQILDQHADLLAKRLGVQFEIVKVATKDPAAAATFAVTALPPGEARRTAVTQAVTNWVQNDPAAVARWLGQQKAGTDLDEAITWLATHPDAIRGNTITALQWANQIGDRELRTQTLVRILSSLDRNRPDTIHVLTHRTKPKANRTILWL